MVGINWLTGGLALVAFVCLFLTARVEESENIEHFGEAYREYMQHTKMFVPLLL